MTKQMIETDQPILLIDIDDTLITQKPNDQTHRGYRLLALIRQMACDIGLEVSVVDRAIDEVFDKVWWKWGDYLDALDLDPNVFWPLADADESPRTRPTDLTLPERFERLSGSGYLLCITSNNPTDGIAHKLRQAGFDDVTQLRLFYAIFGTNNMRANKTQPEFWRRVVQSLGSDPSRMTVVGDQPLDDHAVPQQVGIERTLLFSEVPRKAHDWAEIEKILLHASSGAFVDL